MSRNDQELIAPLEKHKFDNDNLINWMEQNNIESKGLKVQQFQGGMSNPTFFLESENNKYVLRKNLQENFCQKHMLLTENIKLWRL